MSRERNRDQDLELLDKRTEWLVRVNGTDPGTASHSARFRVITLRGSLRRDTGTRFWDRPSPAIQQQDKAEQRLSSAPFGQSPLRKMRLPRMGKTRWNDWSPSEAGSIPDLAPEALAEQPA